MARNKAVNDEEPESSRAKERQLSRGQFNNTQPVSCDQWTHGYDLSSARKEGYSATALATKLGGSAGRKILS